MAQTVLITGSSGGIGKATVLAFAVAGWNVAATMRDTSEAAFANVPSVKKYVLDVTSETSTQNAFMDDQDIQKQFDTNLFGLMRVTRAAPFSVMGARPSLAKPY